MSGHRAKALRQQARRVVAEHNLDRRNINVIYRQLKKLWKKGIRGEVTSV